MRVTVGVSGGIAAYKAAELVRALQRQALEVHVVMTACGAASLCSRSPLPRSPATRSSPACGRSGTRREAAAEQNGIEHIAEAQWADALVVAPATANILAKFAHGIADDFLTTHVSGHHRAGAGGAGHEREHVESSGHAGQS